MLDEFAKGLAGDIDAGKQLEPSRRPGGHAAVENGDVRVAVARQDRGSACGEAVAIVAKHNARSPAGHQLRKSHFEAAEWYRTREQQMVLRENKLLAHVDKRDFLAVGEHAAELLRADQ